MTRNFSKTGPERLIQTRRLLQVAAILATARGHDMTIDNVTVKLREQTGCTWHERTVRRDLYGLNDMGIIDREKSLFRWRGHSDGLSRIVVQSAELAARERQSSSAALEALLANLPEPWDMTAELHRVCTSAARLAALADTNDRRCLKFKLIYALGQGWTLQDVGLEPSTFDKFKSLEQLAKSEFDSVQWEPAETPAKPPRSRRPKAVCV